MLMTEEVYTVEEVAQLLKLAEGTITRLFREGEMPGYKVGGIWRIDKKDLDAYREEQKEKQRKKR